MNLKGADTAAVDNNGNAIYYGDQAQAGNVNNLVISIKYREISYLKSAISALIEFFTTPNLLNWLFSLILNV